MGRHRYELKDSEWNRIAEMLPKEHPPEGKRGRPTKYDNRTVMNGIVWIARSGAPWREQLFMRVFKSGMSKEL